MKKKCTALILVLILLLTLASPAAALSPGEQLRQQVRETYEEALRRSGNASFQGYCATLVNWSLVILGINRDYIFGNGNEVYNRYEDLKVTTGGFRVTAYPGSRYSLAQALNAITENGTRDARNILVGFHSTTSAAGQRYGHTFFIHGIVDGTVYYCESYGATVGGTKYPEGQVIACSIEELARYYGAFAWLEGVIHFDRDITLRFHPQGGTLEEQEEIRASGEPLGQLPVPLREGYDFAGWYTQPQGGTSPLDGTAVLTSDTELYAHWAGRLYEGTQAVFHPGAGRLPGPEASRKITGFNTGRGTDALIIYNCPGQEIRTNSSGAEAAVDARGRVIALRAPGSSRWLTVPPGGFVLSGHMNGPGSAGAFAAAVRPGHYAAYDPDNREVLIYSDENGYLANHTRRRAGEPWGPLPLPQCPGTEFEGWYTAPQGGTRVTPETPFTPEPLYARWGCTHEDTVLWALPDCEHFSSVTYTCSLCGRTCTEYGDGFYSPWAPAAPPVPEELWEEKLQYRYREPGDREPENPEAPLWGPWSAWEDGSPRPEGPACQVETRTLYRFRTRELEPHLWDEGRVMPGREGAASWEKILYTCTRCGRVQTRITPALPPCEGDSACPSGAFGDCSPGAWYHGAADWALREGLMQGTGETTFSPDRPLTRAMAAALLYRMSGSPPVDRDSPFRDVAPGRWYTEPIVWAWEQGLVFGVSSELFRPEGNLTREQLAALLRRFARLQGAETTGLGDLRYFPDREGISPYAREDMAWAVGQGLLRGAGGRLLPQGTATRAQGATVLMYYTETLLPS